MNNVQAFQLMYARHDRILAREKQRTAEAPAPATRFAEALPQPIQPAQPAASARLSAAPPRIVVPATSLPMGVTAPAATAKAAPVDLSENQMSALMAAFGAPSPERVAAPAKLAAATRATPEAAPVDMSEDQVSALMAAFGGAETPASPLAGRNAAPPILPADQAALLLQSFGIAGHAYGLPEATAPTPEAAEPEQKDEERADTPPTTVAAADTGRFFPANPGEKVASLGAADAYLGAIKNMERNLARYGVR
ncbi:MAG: hypothetical protein IT548_02905 [Alphaproteobacteria bacterium]|nr:hypothetical protein [Alphaproteobacteria bacterium]